MGPGEEVAFPSLEALMKALFGLLAILARNQILSFLKAVWDEASSKSFWQQVTLGVLSIPFWKQQVVVQTQPVESFPREINKHVAALSPFIYYNEQAHATHDQKTTILNQEITALHSQVRVLNRGATAANAVDSVNHRITAVAGNVDKLREEVTNLSRYVNGPYHAALVKEIARAQGEAEIHSRAAMTAAIQAQDDILHRRIVTLGADLGIHIPDATVTLPIALAGVMAYTAVLTAEADTCYNPMCSDWNEAKSLLAGLLEGLTAGGAIAFLAEAIQHPATLAEQVAGYSDEVGGLAIDALNGILGIDTTGKGGGGL